MTQPVESGAVVRYLPSRLGAGLAVTAMISAWLATLGGFVGAAVALAGVGWPALMALLVLVGAAGPALCATRQVASLRRVLIRVPAPLLHQRLHGDLVAVGADVCRPLRSVGTDTADVLGRTDELLGRLTSIPSVRIFRGVRPAEATVPLVGHAVSAGRRLVLVESVAWPPGEYRLDPAGLVRCDSRYIGQTTQPLATAVQACRRALPRSHRVEALVVVHQSGSGRYALPAATPELGWVFADELAGHLRTKLLRQPGTVSRHIIAALAGPRGHEYPVTAGRCVAYRVTRQRRTLPATGRDWLDQARREDRAERDDQAWHDVAGHDEPADEPADDTAAVAARAANRLALAHAARGRLDEAVVQAQRAVRLEPAHAAHHLTLAAILEELGNWSAALRAYTTAAQLEPDCDAAHLGAAGALLAAGDPGAARQILEEIYPRSADQRRAGDSLGLTLAEVAEQVPRSREDDTYVITAREEIVQMRTLLTRAARVAHDPDVRAEIDGVRRYVDGCARRVFVAERVLHTATGRLWLLAVLGLGLWAAVAPLAAQRAVAVALAVTAAGCLLHHALVPRWRLNDNALRDQ
jgi:tetratricopeptide (TPR) repeat protein